jgi:hypothetical protein
VIRDKVRQLRVHGDINYLVGRFLYFCLALAVSGHSPGFSDYGLEAFKVSVTQGEGNI